MMKESLSIKNFGPIKNLELQLKKVNILIGEQGTGKSTVAKLIAIFKSLSFITNPKNRLLDFQGFGIENYFQNNTQVIFSSDNYKVSIKNLKINLTARNELKGFIKEYRYISDKIDNSKVSDEISKLVALKFEIGNKINILTGIYEYIPAERLINSLLSENYYRLVTNKTTIPKYISDFGESYLSAKKSKDRFQLPFGNYNFLHSEKGDFLQIDELKTVNYLESSSGFLSVIPLLLVISHRSSSDRYNGIFLIEEPELNLFPKTQNEVIKEIVSNCLKFNDKVLITTHSPYILTSLNNLIYASRIKKKSSIKVNRIINKKYWLYPAEVSAILLKNDGNSEDIFDLKEGLIDASKIDAISRELNEQFDKLIDIDVEDEN